MAGTWGMTDEQFAQAAAKYRRRLAFQIIGFGIGCVGQVASFIAYDGTMLGLFSGLGFGLCCILSAIAWLKGMPDTRPQSQPDADRAESPSGR